MIILLLGLFLFSEPPVADVKAYMEFGKRGREKQRAILEDEVKTAKQAVDDAKRFIVKPELKGSVEFGEGVVKVGSRAVGLKLQKERKVKLTEATQRLGDAPKLFFEHSELLSDMKPGDICIPYIQAREITGSGAEDLVMNLKLDYVHEDEPGVFLSSTTKRNVVIRSRERIPLEYRLTTPCRIVKLTAREIEFYVFSKEELKELESKAMELLKNPVAK